jgi:hypothetical protein
MTTVVNIQRESAGKQDADADEYASICDAWRQRNVFVRDEWPLIVSTLYEILKGWEEECESRLESVEITISHDCNNDAAIATATRSWYDAKRIVFKIDTFELTRDKIFEFDGLIATGVYSAVEAVGIVTGFCLEKVYTPSPHVIEI